VDSDADRPRRLGQWDRVEHTPRSVRTRAVDALGPHEARDVGIVDKQVQGLALVGHLAGAVRPHDNSECALIDAIAGLRLPRGENGRPDQGAKPLAGLATVVALGLDGEAPMRQ